MDKKAILMLLWICSSVQPNRLPPTAANVAGMENKDSEPANIETNVEIIEAPDAENINSEHANIETKVEKIEAPDAENTNSEPANIETNIEIIEAPDAEDTNPEKDGGTMDTLKEKIKQQIEGPDSSDLVGRGSGKSTLNKEEAAKAQEALIKDKDNFRDSMILDEVEISKSNLKGTQGHETSCNVLILGAGMAGITAAVTLRKLGVEGVQIVEGDSRIGGRIKSVPFGGINVEVGANWVHFSNMNESTYNPVEELVKKAGLNYVVDEYDDVIFRYKGENVTQEGWEAYDQLEKVQEQAMQLARRKEEKGEPDVNYRVALKLADWRPVSPIQQAVEFFEFDFEFGDEPSDTGLKDNYKIFANHGKHDMFVADKRGYSTIIDNMAAKLNLTEGSDLFLNDYVTEIRYAEDGDHKVVVTAKNSKTGQINVYKANYVITTFSIGVLESDFVEFFPRLPPWKEEIIYMYKMTRYIKIFVKFPDSVEAFWDDNHYIIYVDPVTRGRYQMWQNLEAGDKYFPKGTNMLLATVIGNNWETVQHLSKDQVKAELFTVLKSMYGDKAVEPEDILIPDWHKNPLYFGAYSNWPIGVSKATYQNLDAPVGALYFAGEACSPNYSGFVHGAMESGEMTARNLYRCMHESNCEEVPGNGYGYDNSQCTKPKPWEASFSSKQ